MEVEKEKQRITHSRNENERGGCQKNEKGDKRMTRQINSTNGKPEAQRRSREGGRKDNKQWKAWEREDWMEKQLQTKETTRWSTHWGGGGKEEEMKEMEEGCEEEKTATKGRTEEQKRTRRKS